MDRYEASITSEIRPEAPGGHRLAWKVLAARPSQRRNTGERLKAHEHDGKLVKVTVFEWSAYGVT